MIFLPDINTLVALAWPAHPHHPAAERWFAQAKAFATCPITQLGFLRVSTIPMPGYARMSSAHAWLQALTTQTGHVFWKDDVEPLALANVAGPKHLTDRYLLALAGAHSGRLVTFDQAWEAEAMILR